MKKCRIYFFTGLIVNASQTSQMWTLTKRVGYNVKVKCTFFMRSQLFLIDSLETVGFWSPSALSVTSGCLAFFVIRLSLVRLIYPRQSIKQTDKRLSDLVELSYSPQWGYSHNSDHTMEASPPAREQNVIRGKHQRHNKSAVRAAV